MIAYISQTYTKDAWSLGFIFLLKKVSRCPILLRTALTATTEASISTTKGSLKSGRCRVDTCDVCSFKFSNTCSTSPDHVNLWCCNKSMRGATRAIVVEANYA